MSFKDHQYSCAALTHLHKEKKPFVAILVNRWQLHVFDLAQKIDLS